MAVHVTHARTQEMLAGERLRITPVERWQVNWERRVGGMVVGV